MTRPEIQRALAFVADNLDRPITVAEVANAAHLSEFHLHRVFHSSVGYAASPVYRFLLRLAGWFPEFMERRLVACVEHLLTAF